MDINMPQMNGIEATRQITAAHPEVVVFLCSTYDAADLPRDATESGARAYVNKEQFGAATLQRLWDEHSRFRRWSSERHGAADRRALAGGRIPAHGAADRAQPVGHVDEPVAAAGLGRVETGTVVADREVQAARLGPHPDLDGRAGRVLAGVLQGLQAAEVDGRFQVRPDTGPRRRRRTP